MSDFKDLMRRIYLFEENHHKEILENKKKMIFELYKDLLEELKDRKNISTEINSGKYDITILITSNDDLCVSEYETVLAYIITISDVKTVKIVDGKIAIELWFRCWLYRDIEKDA